MPKNYACSEKVVKMYQRIDFSKNYGFLRSGMKIVQPTMKDNVWQPISISQYELILSLS